MKNTHPWIMNLLGLTLLIYGLYAAQQIFIPLAWASLLAIALTPFCNWLEKFKISRGWATSISLVLFIAMLLWIYSFLHVQIQGMLKDIPTVMAKFNARLVSIQHYISGISFLDFDSISNEVSSGLLNNLSGSIQSFFIETSRTIVFVSIIPFYMFFLIYYRGGLLFFLKKLRYQGEDFKPSVVAFKSVDVVKHYIWGLLKVTFVVGLLAWGGLTLVGMPYAIFFAFLVALLNLIPYVGVMASGLIVVFFSFVLTDSTWMPLMTFAVLAGVQLLENNFITPLITSKEVNLNPLAALLAIFIGEGIWGISGVILAIPIFGVLKILLDSFSNLQPYGFLLGEEIKKIHPE